MDDVLASVKAKLKALLAQPAEPIRFAASGPDRDHGGRRERRRQDHVDRQAGPPVHVAGQEGGAGRRPTRFAPRPSSSLTIWADRLGAEIVTGAPGSDPASVAHRAVATAIETGADVCIVDTAGRLQTQQNLMQQLTKIHRVIGKQIPEAPHEVLLVLDATTGQNGISQAKHFTDAVNCTGIVLAKLDGTAKGGVVVAIRQQVGLPVKYVGVGEKAEDLTLFEPDDFVEALFEDLVGAGARGLTRVWSAVAHSRAAALRPPSGAASTAFADRPGACRSARRTLAIARARFSLQPTSLSQLVGSIVLAAGICRSFGSIRFQRGTSIAPVRSRIGD